MLIRLCPTEPVPSQSTGEGGGRLFRISLSCSPITPFPPPSCLVAPAVHFSGAAAGNAYNNFAGSASAGGGDGGGWVTVFGFAPELTSAVVAEFRRYGDIVAQQSPPAGTSGGVSNWVVLRYATAFSAQKACQDGHCVLLHGSLLVGAVPGRPDSSSSSSGLGGGGDMLLDPGSHSAGGLLQSGGDRTGEGLASGRGAISSFRVVPVNSSSRIRERLSWGAWLWEYALG